MNDTLNDITNNETNYAEKDTEENGVYELVLTRDVPVARELVWKAWTTPELLKQWFTPKPYETIECAIDLKPGGQFYTVMRSPEGNLIPGNGCYLEVVENTRLTFTDCLLPGFQPAPEPFMTATISLETIPTGTRYTATVRHKNAEDCENHEKMGFTNGWGTALDQLVELMSR